MDGRSELLAYMGTAIATVAVLFGLQIWYASYLDTHVVNAHPLDAPADAKRVAVRAQEQAKLASGKKPIAQAKVELAQRGRAAFPAIAPKPSEDLSAMSGWMHRPGFKPYVPRQAAQPAPAPGQLAGEAGAAAIAGGQPGSEGAVGAIAEAGQKPALADHAPARAPGRRAPQPAPEPVVKVPPGAPAPTPPAQ